MTGHHQRTVTRNGQAITADEALLGIDDDEWASKDPWRVLRIQAEFVEGFDTLHGLPAAVSIFGSARTAPGGSRCTRPPRGSPTAWQSVGLL